MHAAPPVRMSVAPDAAWRNFAPVCAGAAAANLAAWIAAQLEQATPVVVVAALLAAVLALTLAAWALRRADAGAGVLTWDGAAWFWAPGQSQPAHLQPAAGDLRVMIDLGAWMLLRFAPAAAAERVTWVAVSRRHAAASWPHWRAALFSRRPSLEPAAAADPS